MDMHSQLLNRKWKNYFNWTVIYPLIFFFAFILIMFLGVFLGFASMLVSQTVAVFAEPLVMLFMGVAGLMTVGILVLIIGVLFYWVWFIIASDNLFKMLNMNRVVGNLLNLIGLFIFPGLSFLILPIIFWIKMRDYWDNKRINASWRAVV